MILSRVIEHMKKQHWTAIAIDFFIVVFGVFIGIQLGNWNEARVERAKESGYLVRLHEDMQQSIVTLERTIGLLERQSAAQRYFSTRLRIAPFPLALATTSTTP